MFEKLLLECGCDLLPLRYLQKIKAFDQHWATINKKSKDHPVMAVGKVTYHSSIILLLLPLFTLPFRIG